MLIATCVLHILLFFFNDTATTEIYTLSLHDALPICQDGFRQSDPEALCLDYERDISPVSAGRKLNRFRTPVRAGLCSVDPEIDRKSTRLNSSHLVISYAVFCLKKKTTSRGQHRCATT